VGCRSSLRRGRGGMGCAVHLAGGVNQSGATTPQRGHALHDPHRPGEGRRRCSRHPRQVFQRAHVTVAQRVEDELQLAPGSWDTADVTAAAAGDALPHDPGHTGGGDILDRLDRRPANQTRSLFGDPPPVDMGVRLVMLWRQTAAPWSPEARSTPRAGGPSATSPPNPKRHERLDPAVLKGLHPQRVSQVDAGTTGLQRVHSPVPAVATYTGR